MVGDKLRFRFAKTDELRLLSHHDLLRCVERMLRRAEIPFKRTEGFHPGPRLVFALSLSLGIVGRREVMELELTEARDAEAVRDALQDQAPAGLSFHSVSVVPMKASAVPRRMVYQIAIPADRQAQLRDRAASVLAQDKVWVDRLLPKPRRVNIRPYLRNVSLTAGRLMADIWVTANGSARADELLKLLAVDDIWNAGEILERSELEIQDELPSDCLGNPNDQPPTGIAETLPLNREEPWDASSAGRLLRPEESSTEPTWGLSPSGPVVE